MKRVMFFFAMSALVISTTSAQDIMAQLESQVELSTFLTICKAADIQNTLTGESPVTVFAPTNDAFAALPDGTLESWLLPENKDQLAGIVNHFTVPGKSFADDLAQGKLMTLQGEEVEISVSDAGIMINDAHIIATDIEASNGIVHIIDKIVLPPSQLKN